jgi:hypothetical protein
LYKLLLLAALAAPFSTPAFSTERSPPLSAAAEQDVRCLALGLVGVSMEKDQTKQQGMIAETWYFAGRLDAEAPGLALKPALTGALDSMNGNPKAKETGAACDAAFQKRGDDLKNIGG